MRRAIIIIGIGFLLLAVAVSWLHHHTSRYDYIISQAAARNGVDFYLVKALIYEESWFRPRIRGLAGEVGLMQITPAAAADFTSKKGFPPLENGRLVEPQLNVEIGCWYLRQSLEHYRNSPHQTLFALLRYNAGESRANHWLQLALSAPAPAGSSRENYYLSLVEFSTTRMYARRILDRYRSRNFWY